jgi:hypothetical protein
LLHSLQVCVREADFFLSEREKINHIALTPGFGSSMILQTYNKVEKKWPAHLSRLTHEFHGARVTREGAFDCYQSWRT